MNLTETYMNFKKNSKDFDAEIYIDLGTANTLVMTRDKGLVANEPSVIAYRDLGNGQKHIIGVGNDAKVKVGRTPGNVVASFPLKDGVIADLDTTKAMLQYFMSKAQRRFSFSKPRIVVSIPYGARDIERQAVKEAGKDAGAREVILIEEPVAAAIGSGLPIELPQGNMIIDIGGGTTDIAVISLYSVVHCESIRVGGYLFDQAIVEYIRRQHNLIVGDQSAERVKIELGCAIPGDTDKTASIRGVDYLTGLPREIHLTSAQVHEAMADLLGLIFDAGRRTLEQIPPELVQDILKNGAWVAGGGALIRRLDERLSAEWQIPVQIAPDPLLAIANGGQKAINDPWLLENIALY